MSSSLLVSSSSGSVSAFGDAPASSNGNAPSGFEALLAVLSGAGSDEAALKAGIGNLLGEEVVDLKFEAGALVGVQLAGQDKPLSLADLAQAAGIELPAEPEAPGDAPALLAELLERLARLGDDPDNEQLAEIDQLLDALAAALDLPLGATPTPAELARMGANLLVEGATTGQRLTGLLADFAAGLARPTSGEAEDGATLARDLAAKLGAFAAALDETGADGEPFARLGLAGDAEPLTGDLQARIAALVAGKTGIKPAPTDAPLSTDPRLTEVIASGEATGESDAPEARALSDVGAARADKRPAGSAAQMPETTARLAAAAQADAPQGQSIAAEIATQTGTRVETAPVARPVVAGYQTSQQQINLPQIAFEISRQTQQGNTHFQIRLDPPELGRIDVRMEIDQAGNVHARLTVEKSETLDLMQRDQRTLERALAQAGMDGTKTNLEFSLRQNPFAQQDQGGRGSDAPVFGGETAAEPDEPPAPAVTLYRGAARAGGINILA
ncbi:flagellar hook-length control protein FliK [Devosia nitrariae]|uniref:Flagellar hook-length control protein-like C-terminal domain-containing protein n=1 Tax=Devosia nitrariae TaxID=2071872 RepID=A0ABQ5W7U6_9HYPH|nr:flagellar hook-length control protein FliK [Devosia nitrariae]GLQ55841.1 hypothetical protein GCM10010862_31000 [Devosia nitrariae]